MAGFSRQASSICNHSAFGHDFQTGTAPILRRIESLRASLFARSDNLALGTGAALFAIGFAALPFRQAWDFIDGLAVVPHLLVGGGWLGDVFQDQIGMRLLVDGGDPYPILGPALAALGVDWPLTHASTHPPTAFLLAAPIAWLDRAQAGQGWALLSLALIFASARLYGVRWRWALGLTLGAAAWKPAAMSFNQITFFWLFGLALAFRCRGALAGMGVGIAAMTKLFPVGLLGYLACRRRLGALTAAVATLAAACMLVHWLNPDAWPRYFDSSNRANSWLTILRDDNLNPLRQAYRLGGVVGLAAMAAFITFAVAKNWRLVLVPSERPEHAFFFYSALAVVLLPIMWPYSLLPLFPILAFFIVRGAMWQAVLALGLLVAMGQQHWLNAPAMLVLFCGRDQTDTLDGITTHSRL